MTAPRAKTARRSTAKAEAPKPSVCRVPNCDKTEDLFRELCPPHFQTHRGLAAPKDKEES